MNHRVLAAVIATAAVLAVPVSAQAPGAANTRPVAKKSAIPRAQDGHPDLQGVWTNATVTPVERPAQFANRMTISDTEATIYEKENGDIFFGVKGDTRSSNPEQDRDHAYNALFFDRGSELARVDGQKRTSLVIDPADGRIPFLSGRGGRGGRNNGASVPVQAADEGTRGATGAQLGRYDKVQDRPLAERCLLGFGSTSGPPMMPVLYNNNYQIVQTPDSIMILVEMVHDTRIIRMNGKHSPEDLRFWLGDSIGHWEDDVLVVETTNFDPHVRYRGSSEHLKVTERFRMTEPGTIIYRATIEDPTVFSKPWTMEYPFLATVGPVYEYACHEGNYAMPDILGGARKQESETRK